MNFPLILLVLTVFTGVMWVADMLVWKKQRKQKAAEDLRAFDAIHGADTAANPQLLDQRKVVEYKALSRPSWLEWTAGIFPVILLVFIVRSFVWEPFRIPSGSMLPTLQSGDFIVVNKYQYGMRFPVLNTKLTEGTKPKAGDVIVFDHPMQPGTDLIKRIVACPGDRVSYVNKVLYVNDQEQKQAEVGDYVDEEVMITLAERRETLGGKQHRMAVDSRAPNGLSPMGPTTHPGAIRYSDTGFETRVPEGHYLVLGDNRDNSDDGRYWGFVPEENIIGRAFFIWLNLSHPSRIGSFE